MNVLGFNANKVLKVVVGLFWQMLHCDDLPQFFHCVSTFEACCFLSILHPADALLLCVFNMYVVFDVILCLPILSRCTKKKCNV